jgi:hypothetical protein
VLAAAAVITQLLLHLNTKGFRLVCWLLQGGDGGIIKLQGQGSSAEITQKDIYACKVDLQTWKTISQQQQQQQQETVM